MQRLTERQMQVLQLIVDSVKETGTQPTIRTMCEKMDISSPNGIACHIRPLIKKGLLKKKPGQLGYVIENFKELNSGGT
jgi:repressor LexA